MLVGSYTKYSLGFNYHRHWICTLGKLDSIYTEVFTYVNAKFVCFTLQ